MPRRIWPGPQELADYLEALPPGSKAIGKLGRGPKARCCLGHYADMARMRYDPNQGLLPTKGSYAEHAGADGLPNDHWLLQGVDARTLIGGRNVQGYLADVNDGTRGFRKVIETLRSLPKRKKRVPGERLPLPQLAIHEPKPKVKIS